MKIEIKEYTIAIFVDGEELYDAHGSASNRRLVLKAVLTDNEGYIISLALLILGVFDFVLVISSKEIL